MLNLHFNKRTQRHNNTKQRQVDNFLYKGIENVVKRHGEYVEDIGSLVWVCFGVKIGFKLLSEGGQKGRHTTITRRSIPNRGGIKSKAITKL